MLAVSCGGTSTAGAAIEVQIGSLNQLTGQYAGIGIPVDGGIKVVVHDINAAGGFTVAGKQYKLKVVSVDTASTTAGASAGLTQLIRDDGVKFIFGAGDTPSANIVQAQAAQAHVLFVTTATIVADNLNTNGPNTDLNRYTFDISPTSLQLYGPDVRGYIKLYPDTKTAAIIYPSFASFDVHVNAFKQLFAMQNVTTVDVERFDASTNDFTPLLTRIKAKHPDVLVVGASPAPVTAVTKQMVDLGDVAKGVIGLAGASVALSGATGKPLPFPYVYAAANGIDPYVKAPGVQQFFDAYRQVNGTPVLAGQEAIAAYYYGPVKALVKAMQDAGTIDDVGKISASMTKVTVRNVVGDYSYQANHIALASTAICAVVDGKVSCGSLERMN